MPTKKPNIRAYSLAFILPLVLVLPALATWAQAPDTNPGDSEMVGGGTNLPPRLEVRRFRITFQDEFNGPQPGMSPAKLACFDWAQTPAQCAQENWPTGNCDAAYAANLADLDKCTWLVHDRMIPSEIDGHFIPKETKSLSYHLTFPSEHKGMKLSSVTLSSSMANNDSLSCRLGGRVDGKNTHFTDLNLTPELANRSEVYVAYGNPKTGEEACFVVSLKHHGPNKDTKSYNITGRK